MSFNFLKKNATTRSYPTDILIGELFVKAGIISQKQLDDTARLAGTKHLHIGQMLVMSGFIKQRDLQAAVDAQSMMRDKVVDINQAARCLKIAVKTGATFEELVREELAIGQQANSQTNKLGEMLLEARIITKENFNQAMGRCLATGLPLGRILVLNGSLPDGLLRFALELQVRVRDGMMTRAEAIDALRAEAAKLGSVNAAGDFTTPTLMRSPSQKQLRLGELLVVAGLITETDVMSCLELGLMTERPIGEVMVDQGYVSPDMLNIALAVQAMAEEGRLNRDQAGAALKEMQSTGVILPEVMDRINGTYVPNRAPAAGDPSVLSTDSAPSLESLMAAVSGSESMLSHQDEIAVNTDQDKAGNGADPLAEEFRKAMQHASRSDASSAGVPDASAGAGDIAGGVAHRASQTRMAAATNASTPVITDIERLLISANVVSTEDIDRAFALARSNPLVLTDLLRTTGFLSQVGTQAVIDCQHHIDRGDFTPEQAAQVLDHCINKGRAINLTFEQALIDLGWTKSDSPEQGEASPPLSSLLASFGESAGVDSGDAIQDAVQVELAPQADLATQHEIPLSNLFQQLEGSDSLVEQKQSIDAAARAEVLSPGSDFELKYEDRPPVKAEELAVVEELDLGVVVQSASMQIDETIADEQKPSDLLSLFGLAEHGSDSEEAVARSSQTASQAEALLASLSQGPREEIQRIEQEAAAERPESFENTAVFKRITESEVEDIVADSIAKKAQAAQAAQMAEEAALPEPGDAILSSLLGSMQAAETQEPQTAQPVQALQAAQTEQEAQADQTAQDNIVVAPPAVPAPEPVLPVATAPAAASPDPIVNDDVDLRSLFSGLGSASQETPAAPAAPAPELAAPPAPAAPAPVASTTPAPVAPAAPTPIAPAATAPVAPAASAAPAPAAPAPAPTPDPFDPMALARQIEAATGVAATPQATSTRLPRLNDAEVTQAKAAQMAAMGGALTKMAEMHYEAENFPEAQKAYERILSWRQGELGPNHVDLVDDLNNLAGVMCVQGNFAEAEPMIQRAVDILEVAEKPDPLKLAENLTSLAGLQFQQGVFDKAEPLLSKALQLRESHLGPNSVELADSLRDYAKLLKKLGRLEEAEKHYMRAKVLLGKA